MGVPGGWEFQGGGGVAVPGGWEFHGLSVPGGWEFHNSDTPPDETPLQGVFVEFQMNIIINFNQIKYSKSN